MRRLRFACLLFLLVSLPARSADYWLRTSLDHEMQTLHARVFADDNGHYFVRRLDLRALGIAIDRPSTVHQGEELFYDIDDIPGYRLRVDPDAGYLHILTAGGPPHFAANTVLLLDLDIDGGPAAGEPVVVQESEGTLKVPAETLAGLGIRTDNLPVKDGNVPIEALAGDDYVLDTHAMRLWFKVPPEQRTLRRVLTRREQVIAPQPGIPSASFDYDVSGSWNELGDTWRSSLLGTNLAMDFGYCRNRDAQVQADAAWRRLDTYCGYDWPSHPTSLLLGDTVSRSDTLGQPVRYGGLRFGTDYSLTPTASLQPDTILSGTARVPSVLELWVNHLLALRQPVGPGPFELDQIPVLSGAGDISLVLQDALGRRQEISQPYYTDPRLLRTGLADWSAEAGRLRVNFGLPDDTYTDAIGVASGRYGLRDWLTLSGRAEYQQDALAALGGGATVRMGQVGMIEAGTLASAGLDGNDARGSLYELAFSRHTDRYSLGLRYTGTTRTFRQLGYDTPGSAPASVAQANAGFLLPAHVSLNVGAFRETRRADVDTMLYTAGVSRPVFRGGQVALNAIIPESGGNADNFYGLSFTLALGAGRSASAGASRQGSVTAGRYNIQQSLPTGTGYGYRLDGSDDSNGFNLVDAALQAQNDLAYLEVGGENNDGFDSARARLAGSVLLTAQGVQAVRRDDTAALVHLPAAGVRIFRDNQLVTRTDADGDAVVSGLRPYEANRIGFASEDLPANATSSTDVALVAPGRHQVVATSFAVDTATAITANLVDAAGAPLPTGAQVVVDGKTSDAAVGYNGLLYLRLTEAKPATVLVRWPEHSCEAQIPAPPADAALWHAGQITCRENNP